MARSSNDGYTLTSPGTPLAGHDSMGASNSLSRGMRWQKNLHRTAITFFKGLGMDTHGTQQCHKPCVSHGAQEWRNTPSITHTRFLCFFLPFFQKKPKLKKPMDDDTQPTHTHTHNSSSNDDASTAQVFYKGVQSCEADTERSFRGVRCCVLVSCMRAKKKKSVVQTSVSPPLPSVLLASSQPRGGGRGAGRLRGTSGGGAEDGFGFG